MPPKPLTESERQNMALWGGLSSFAFDEISRLQRLFNGRPQPWMTFERWIELEDFQRAELRTAMDRFPGGKKWLGLLDERRWQTPPEELEASRREPGESRPTKDSAAADTAKSLTEKPGQNLAMPRRIADAARIFSPLFPRPTAPDLGKPVPLTPEYEAAMRARGKQIPDTTKRRLLPLSALQTGRQESISQVKSPMPETVPLAGPVPETAPLAGRVPVAENETEFTVKIRKARKQTRTPEQSVGPPSSVEITTRTNARQRKVEKPEGSQNPDVTAVAAIQYKRDPSVKAWVLQNARGVCECCKQDAPFFYSDGVPYLEVHHVRQLREGGSDTVSNAVALCPNCHKELHFGAKKNELIIDLYTTVSRLRQE